MNWQKYTLDEWLEQFGAWCESCRMRTGHYPDALKENLINKLMIETGLKKVPAFKNRITCRITDKEALEVQDLLFSCYDRADEDIQTAIKCLFDHKVQGISLRRLAYKYDTNKHDVERKIYGARYYIKGLYGFIRLAT